MLSRYLNDAIEDIKRLIQITHKDISDIKKAQHEEVFSRTKIKNELIISFEAKKALLDNELVLLTKANPDRELSEILDESDSDNLAKMKDCLVELHVINKKYAKFVVSVSEFYNSTLEAMFPSEVDGYNKNASKPANFLKVSV